MAKKTRNPPPRARSRRGAPPPPPLSTPAAALSPPLSPVLLCGRLGAAQAAVFALGPPFSPVLLCGRLGATEAAAPVLIPPFSPVRLRGRLGAAEAAAAAVEHPYVTLWEWCPVRLEGEERKLAVSGFTEKNDLFTSAPIAQRYKSFALQDEDGILVFLNGPSSLWRMRENGFSMQICEQFMTGFPHWWETWDSHMESYPNSFTHPQEDSDQFYREKFQLGNFIQKFGPSLIKDLNDANKLPINDLDAFTGGSRFQEHNCGNDVSTKENSAASDDARTAAVASVQIGLNSSSTSQERDHVNIEDNVSLAPTETYTGDETCKEAGNQNDTMHPDAREDGAGSHLFNSDWTCTMSPDHTPNDSEGGNANNAELLALDPLATVPPKSSNCCSEIAGAFQSVEPLSYQNAPVASLKNQQYLERSEHITLIQKAVSNENLSSSIHSDVQSPKKRTVGSAEKQRSARQGLGRPTRLNLAPYVRESRLTRSRVRSLSISTPESLKLRRTKSGRVIVPQLDPGRSRIVYDRDGFVSGIAPVQNGLLRSSRAKFACRI